MRIKPLYQISISLRYLNCLPFPEKATCFDKSLFQWNLPAAREIAPLWNTLRVWNIATQYEKANFISQKTIVFYFTIYEINYFISNKVRYFIKNQCIIIILHCQKKDLSIDKSFLLNYALQTKALCELNHSACCCIPTEKHLLFA